MNTTNASTMFTLRELEHFTTYTISVAARTGAGVGNASNGFVVKTTVGGKLVGECIHAYMCTHIHT